MWQVLIADVLDQSWRVHLLCFLQVTRLHDLVDLLPGYLDDLLKLSILLLDELGSMLVSMLIPLIQELMVDVLHQGIMVLKTPGHNALNDHVLALETKSLDH